MKSRLRALKPKNLICLGACLLLLVMGLGAAIRPGRQEQIRTKSTSSFNSIQDTSDKRRRALRHMPPATGRR